MADWKRCPACALAHSPRADGRCPRCGAALGASAAAVNAAAANEPELAERPPLTARVVAAGVIATSTIAAFVTFVMLYGAPGNRMARVFLADVPVIYGLVTGGWRRPWTAASWRAVLPVRAAWGVFVITPIFAFLASGYADSREIVPRIIVAQVAVSLGILAMTGRRPRTWQLAVGAALGAAYVAADVAFVIDGLDQRDWIRTQGAVVTALGVPASGWRLELPPGRWRAYDAPALGPRSAARVAAVWTEKGALVAMAAGRRNPAESDPSTQAILVDRVVADARGGGEFEELAPRETARTAAGEAVLIRARTTASMAGAKPRDALWAVHMEGDEYVIVKASAPVRRFPELEQELRGIVTGLHR